MQFGFGLLPGFEIIRKIQRPSEILENPRTIGEQIKRERQLRGLRQCDVAKELQVNTYTICNWERGRAIGRPRFYPAIIRWLGYDPFPIPESSNETLHYHRLRLGLTSQEMASQLGIDQGTLLRRERFWGVSRSATCSKSIKV